MSPSSSHPQQTTTPGFQSEYSPNPEENHRTQLEDKLEQLLQSMLEVGICTTDVQESAREGGRTARGEVLGPGGLMGKKVNESIQHMAELYELNASNTSDIPIPLDVVTHVDQGSNPDRWLRSFVERAAHENMYTNGILHNVNYYRNLLQNNLKEFFPELHHTLQDQKKKVKK